MSTPSLPVEAPSHVASQLSPLFAADDTARIRYVQKGFWIQYPGADDILRRLEDLLVHPRSHRMPNLLIVGNTNNGKTRIVRRFTQMHPCIDNPEGNGIILPVLYVQAPSGPDEKRLYNRILEKINAPHKPNDRIDYKQMQVLQLLRHLKVDLLILDEIQDIISGSTNKQRQFLSVIKQLGNELEIPIVAVGTHSAFNALQIDEQLANRFRPMLLPVWTSGDAWDRLLVSFERRLPLRKESGLVGPELNEKLLLMSEGLLGELATILAEATARAISSKQERITPAILGSLGWARPSLRRRAV